MTIVPSDLEMRAVDVFFVAAVDGNLSDENWLNERISWEGGGNRFWHLGGMIILNVNSKTFNKST